MGTGDYQQARKYWKNIKLRLKNEGSEVVTNCCQLTMTAEDGKQRLTDVANAETLLRSSRTLKSRSSIEMSDWI